ncbi:MAG: TonB family protein [Pseudomonadota bacterium]
MPDSRFTLHAFVVTLGIFFVLRASAATPDELRGVARPVVHFDACAKPAWPKAALRDESVGTMELGFLVREDGTLERGVILHGSGDTRLDQAALSSISKCKFSPGAVKGKPVRMWMPIIYVWSLEGEAERDDKLTDATITAASAGDSSAQYNVALLYSSDPDTLGSQAQYLQWLRKAAAGGNAMAQYQLAQHYEAGLGIAADPVQATALYRASAEQGNVLAIERLAVPVAP